MQSESNPPECEENLADGDRFQNEDDNYMTCVYHGMRCSSGSPGYPHKQHAGRSTQQLAVICKKGMSML